MIRLKRSETLQRLIRQDDIADLGVSDWTLLRRMIKEGDKEEALRILDYSFTNYRGLMDSLILFRQMALTEIASHGEEQVDKIHRARFVPYVKNWLETTAGVMESMQRFTEAERGTAMIDFAVVEEPDRYVVSLDPCGTGGRMRRAGQVKGVTRKGYTWSWGMAGVPYYCTHCCAFHETLATEVRGYPICVTDFSQDPDKPCRHLYYKEPELIPDEYFTRIGHVPYRLRKDKKQVGK